MGAQETQISIIYSESHTLKSLLYPVSSPFLVCEDHSGLPLILISYVKQKHLIQPGGYCSECVNPGDPTFLLQ